MVHRNSSWEFLRNFLRDSFRVPPDFCQGFLHRYFPRDFFSKCYRDFYYFFQGFSRLLGRRNSSRAIIYSWTSTEIASDTPPVIPSENPLKIPADKLVTFAPTICLKFVLFHFVRSHRNGRHGSEVRRKNRANKEKSRATKKNNTKSHISGLYFQRSR